MLSPRLLLILALCLALSPRIIAQVMAPEQPAVTAKPAETSTKWEKAIVAFETADTANPPPKKAVVFVGSSTLRFWKTMQQDFPEVPVIDRGFGGSQTSDSVKYADRIVIPYDPRVVVTYAGGNDFFYSKLTPAQVMEQYTLLDAELRKALPDVIIIHLTLNPTILRLSDEPKVREFNQLLADYVKDKPKMLLVDTYSKLIGPDGKPQEKYLREDKLHPSVEGYRVLAETIKPVLLKAYVDAGGTLNSGTAAK